MAGNKSSGNKEQRTRNWTFVLYEDSAPEKWSDILDDEHIEWIESPWHDKDINGDGSPKKKHKHIALLFGSVKSYEQVKEVTDKLNAPIPQRCHNIKSLVRYMAHLDNPEKAQYSVSEIIGHGGVDIAEMFRPSSSERYTIIRDMISYIKSNNISEFQDLMDYAASEHFDDWFPLLCDSSAFVVGQYIKSVRHRKNSDNANQAVSDRDDKMLHVDPATGEIIS